MSPRQQVTTTVLALAGISAVVLLAVLVVTGSSDAFDRTVIEIARSPQLSTILWPLGPITELGSTLAVTIVAGATVIVGLAIGPWIHGLIGAAVIGAASVGNSLLKALVARERPELLEPILVERGFSFPSGHAALAMVGWGILAVLVSRSRVARPIRRWLIGALGVIVVLVGVSRVWLGVHYPTDVLAGWIAGAVVVLLYARLTREVSMEPAEGAADADREAPRSGPPATG